MSPSQAKPLPTNPYNPFAWVVGEPQIGEGTWIGAFTLVDGSGGLTLGKGCNVSSGAQILSHSTVRRCVTERRFPAIDKKATVVGDYVFIGANAVIQMGAKIGHHSVVGAGAVVLEDAEFPPFSLIVGVPARLVRSLESEIADWSSAPHEPA